MTANRAMLMSIVVKLVERVTAPLDRIIGKIRGLSAVTDRIGRLTGRIGELGRRIGALGTIGAGLSFIGPLKAAAAFESVLRDIGITAGLTDRALEGMIKDVGPEMQKLGPAVGQSSIALLEGLRSLGASGLDLQAGRGLMPIIGRVATAAGAEVLDVSRSAFALTNNLKVTIAEMEEALGMLVTAGKLGRFEFRDMARYLPSLTAGIQKFGINGKEAVATLSAAAQVAMFNASDPAIAANNLENLFQKAFSKETIKNFESVGVDIIGTMHNASVRGINTFEAYMQKVLQVAGMSAAEVKKIYDEARAGGLGEVEALEKVRENIERIGGAAKIQTVFQDKQVLDAVLAFFAHLDKYKAFKTSILKGGADVIATDFAARMAGLEAKMLRFAETAEQAIRRVGTAFSRYLAPANSALSAVTKGVERFDKWMPGVSDDVLFFAGGALLAVTAIGLLGGVLAGVAVIGAPVAAVLLGLAAVALLIMRYWEPIGAFFSDVLRGLREGWEMFVADISAWWQRLVNNLTADFAAFGDWLQRRWEAMVPGWVREMFTGAASAAPATGRAGFAPAGTAANAPEQKVGGRIVVEVQGPARVRSVDSDNRDVPLSVDRGLMVGVP